MSFRNAPTIEAETFGHLMGDDETCCVTSVDEDGVPTVVLFDGSTFPAPAFIADSVEPSPEIASIFYVWIHICSREPATDV